MLCLTDNNSAFDSKEYDRKVLQTIPYYEEIYKQIIDLIKVHKSDGLSFLDLGCGTGKIAEVAFPNLDIRRFVFVDSSENMIKIVKERFADIKSEFNVCNIINTSYTEEFDVVTAILVNHYFHKEEKTDVLKKCYSALRSGGIYVGFENFMPYTEYGKHLALERWKAYQLCKGKNFKECQEHINRFGVDYFPITISEHLEIMKQSGFDVAEIFWLSNMQVGIYGIKH